LKPGAIFMKLVPSAAFVKQSLAGHSWIGLMVGALMYLVCLSGTLAVFYKEIERWEQPQVQESTHYDAATIERAYHGLVERGAGITHHMFIALPTADMPRTSISSADAGWFVNEDGSLGPVVEHEWTHLLVNLHLYLHLPENIGMLVVSTLGALLCALIISGLLAHPRIFRDAFALRLRGPRLLEQADIHNRLSVWSSPFQLMIAVTGAYFGLAQLMAILMASVYFDGNTEALRSRVYGEELSLQQPARPIALQKALAEMQAMAPRATPFYITIEEADTPRQQHMVIGAGHPNRLIYAEQYRFDSAGKYLGKTGYSDGETGRQVIYSLYRLHFGHFAGYGVKMLYFVLGLAMTVVCVTGFNVWLARRKRRDYWNNVWAGFVWGAIPALAVSAIAQVLLGIAATAVFWIVMVAAVVLAQRWNDERLSKRRLEIAGAASIVALVFGHAIKFGVVAFVSMALWVNAALLLAAVALLLAGLSRKSRVVVESSASVV
jgi:uncharacterized iron-regulated membrane protein